MSETNNFLGFNIVEKIGEGAFSTTYLGEQKGRLVSIKIIEIPNPHTKRKLSAEELEGAAFQDSLRRTSSQLNDVLSVLVTSGDRKGILRYFDYHISGDPSEQTYQLGVLTEHLENLDSLIAKGNLRVRQVLKIGYDLSDGLQRMADAGVFHGNIKESNIFFDNIKGFKLGDFFFNDILIQTLQISDSYTDFGYRFLAPEAYDNKPYSQATDMFTFGILLYKLLNNGSLPFQVESMNHSIRDVRERFVAAKKLPPSPFIPEPILAVLNKATAFVPEERYESFADFKAALKDASRQLEISQLDRLITSNINTNMPHSFSASYAAAPPEREYQREPLKEEPMVDPQKHPEAGIPFTISLGVGEAEEAPKESYTEVIEPPKRSRNPRKTEQGGKASQTTVDYLPGPNEAMVLKEYTQELDKRDVNLSIQEDIDPDYNYSEDELEDDSVKNKIGTIAFVIALIAISALLFILIPHIKNLFK